MIQILRSRWAVVLIGAGLYGAVTGHLLLTKSIVPNTPQGASRAGAKPRPSWEFFNPEVDRLIEELAKEKETLNLREKQLAELAARLEAERAEINIVTQAVYQLQKEFDRNVLRVKEEEQANLKKLGKVYAAMTPDGAVNILKQMEDDQVAKILIFMKEEETAPLLEGLAKMGEAEAKRAATLSERLRAAIYRNATTKK